MKTLPILLLSLMTLACQGEWHSLTKLTPAQRQSAAYKFLVSKFGAPPAADAQES